MRRLILLLVSAQVIFLGFGLPFFVGGYVGFVASGLAISLGSFLFWFFEMKTRKH